MHERRSVWIVDDSPGDAEHARRALEADYETTIFNEGSTVLERLHSGARPDVVVLDWLMPQMSGIEVCRFMRSCCELERVQILILTAQTRPERTAEGLEAGANDYLQKPFSAVELRARIGALVRASCLLDRAEGAEARLRDLLAHAPDAIVGIDAEGRVTYTNPEAERALGVRGMTGVLASELLPALAGALAGIPEGVAKRLGDLTLGDRIYAATARVHHGQALRTVLALSNVTEQRREEARRAEFYSIVAHDLRSPLTAIALRTDLILRGKRGLLPAALIEDLRRIDANTRGLVALISDFLDLSRIEGTREHFEPQEVDVAAVARKALSDLEPLVQAKGLCLTFSAPEERVCVLGDVTRLTQVVMNLVGNAIKFTPEGGRIAVAIGDPGDTVELSVEDTGVGIPEHLVGRVFDRFARADAPRDPTTGTGLGLTIVREIVAAHGGDVGLESALGKGSRFWVRLPTCPESARRRGPAEPACREVRASNGR